MSSPSGVWGRAEPKSNLVHFSNLALGDNFTDIRRKFFTIFGVIDIVMELLHVLWWFIVIVSHGSLWYFW